MKLLLAVTALLGLGQSASPELRQLRRLFKNHMQQRRRAEVTEKCQELFKEFMEGDTKKCADYVDTSDECATIPTSGLDKYCSEDCGTILGKAYDELNKKGCLDSLIDDDGKCDSNEAKDVCNNCQTKCSSASDCCGDEKCAEGPNSTKICMNVNANPDICDGFKFQMTADTAVGLLKSNWQCAKTSAGTYCETFSNEVMTCDNLDTYGCCLPTSYKMMEILAGSQADTQLEKSFSGCAETIKKGDTCSQVNLNKLKSAAPTVTMLAAVAMSFFTAALLL